MPATVPPPPPPARGAARACWPGRVDHHGFDFQFRACAARSMLCAIEEEKPIQLVIELEQRFHAFDVTAWNASAGDTQRKTKMATGEEQAVPPAICRMINENLPNAVTYRRRDFEQDAMMRELCHRGSLVLPAAVNLTAPALVDARPLTVAVISNGTATFCRSCQSAPAACRSLRRRLRRTWRPPTACCWC